jgi:hypothetical protein
VSARYRPSQTVQSGTQRARYRISGRQAQPDVAASAAATSATVLRIPSVVIFTIFCKQAIFVTFMVTGVQAWTLTQVLASLA